ncbi:polyadenylate-binding protein-like [Patiria miniata]|uniref:PABC domain-containing protein n=1 Tax=Patiria miniata TaxID=46514 RepID=A0A914AJR4_PATMI|nr:polyadenylate-binding protein-like [Patiria miniata]XP_038063861.1 polyadenylate-binding protein-like [Patiria miniata]XP_038063862.1 polyadenylate-binding protein-like [Patiria miniata]XP_038063863.1 polyadenylate-binding protein-like [Patiria miniata]
MLPGDYDHLPDAKQILGEHLFTKVEELYPQQASHITGILLEAGNQEVMRMLQDEGLLRRRVEGAKRVIDEECAKTEGNCLEASAKDSLGEQLYFQVQQLGSHHCAKVTGMLLELSPDTINSLLASPQELQRAVRKATATLLQEQPEDGYRIEMDEEKQELGEELYCIIEEAHPELASKLTGMLLEMDATHLRQLLDHPDKLNEKVQLALETLKAACLPT